VAIGDVVDPEADSGVIEAAEAVEGEAVDGVDTVLHRGERSGSPQVRMLYLSGSLIITSVVCTLTRLMQILFPRPFMSDAYLMTQRTFAR
jgi:hypothetical protein